MNISDFHTIVHRFDVDTKPEETSDETIEVNLPINKDNVVSGEKLRMIQNITLNNTKDFLAMTYGPMGSNTKIIKGQNQAEITSSYSKDGLKVLENIINSGPIEASIVDELISITRAVEKEVGDGTTSTVIISSFIFDRLMKIEKKYKLPPFSICRIFQEIVDEIKELILKEGRDCTVDDIYNIAMISTNGNKEVAENIKYIYETYGMDVDLNIGISNTEDSVVKVYDGLTITEGFSDPVFINNAQDNTAEIHDANIYHFVDPIDNMEMISLFEAIINHNIYEPLAMNELPVPTVITCPRISADLSSILRDLANQLYQYNNGHESQKPPIMIITDVVASDEAIMDDIANLCGCKSIHKYIYPKVLERDKEAGLAPTIENVWEFAGTAELVVADTKKTKFINPKHMVADESGEHNDPIYQSMINFLETEIDNAKDTENANHVGFLKKRLAALRSNLVDYLVGGVTIADRDMKKDLVEDAIKNCKSASLYGIGYAANYMGLSKAYIIAENYLKLSHEQDNVINKFKADVACAILGAYSDAVSILYNSAEMQGDKIAIDYVFESIMRGKPYDISTGILPTIDDKESGDNVLCSIKLDVNILNTISKIITMMVTCNQCLLQASHLNLY